MCLLYKFEASGVGVGKVPAGLDGRVGGDHPIVRPAEIRRVRRVHGLDNIDGGPEAGVVRVVLVDAAVAAFGADAVVEPQPHGRRQVRFSAAQSEKVVQLLEHFVELDGAQRGFLLSRDRRG